MAIIIGLGNYIGNKKNIGKPSVEIIADIYIKDSVTKTPIIGALIVFNDNLYLSDSNGLVKLKGFTNKLYTIEIHRPGYETIIINGWNILNLIIYLVDKVSNLLTEFGMHILTENGKLVLTENDNIKYFIE